MLERGLFLFDGVPPILYSVFSYHPPKILALSDRRKGTRYKSQHLRSGILRAPLQVREGIMFDIHIESVGDMAVVQCEGRLVQSDAAYRLRDAILSQRNSSVVVVDLSEVRAIEGGGLGMLAYLQRWAHDHNIKLKLFNPSGMVQDRLDHTWMPSLEIASMDEVIALLDRADGAALTRSQ